MEVFEKKWFENPISKAFSHIRKQAMSVMKGIIVVEHDLGKSGLGKLVSVQVYSRTHLDPNTGKGKVSEKADLKEGKSKKGIIKNGNKLTKTTTYEIKLSVESEFGIPGALLITNNHKHKFFLKFASLQVQIPNDDNSRRRRRHTIHFHCDSWVYPVTLTASHRIFFSNTSYLPRETPRALMELRKEELKKLIMGKNGDEGTKGERKCTKGERKEWEQIYEYDTYNDIVTYNNNNNNNNNNDKSSEHINCIFGGSPSFPYPRRGKTMTSSLPFDTTGRNGSSDDDEKQKEIEMILEGLLVVGDERLSQSKQSEFVSIIIEAIFHHFIIPKFNQQQPQKIPIDQNSSINHHFNSFIELHNIFTTKQPFNLPKLHHCSTIKHMLHKFLPPSFSWERFFQSSRESLFKVPMPQIVKENKSAWKDDDEFARQMLAGTNPVRIKCLKRFPPESKNGAKSAIKASDIEQNMDSLILTQAMKERRIFVLDHHDYLMPFLNRINKNGVFAYASRTLLFLRNDSTLKLLAIELSLPYSQTQNEEEETEDEFSWVYLPATHGIDAALWHLAKAHVAANDSVHHQLITHWLHTHAVIEPFILATRRQLSVIHPIYRLLDPHFKDTMHINSIFRSILLKSDGIFEKILFSGKLSMELSSELYKEWRFNEQGLPADLLKRNMAKRDPDPRNPTGVQLILQDYPYAEDGLEIWTAIHKWVKDFCSIFYKDDDSIRLDEEIQAWWYEIRYVGHQDKSHESGWYEMTTLSDLVEALTTLIWITSAFHAAVNSGQYAYASYPLNRPTLCNNFIPSEGTMEFAELLSDPDKYYLKMLPGKYETVLGATLMEVLSHHMSNELYLGMRSSTNWTDNEKVQYKFSEFVEELKQIDKRITERNQDPKRKNRTGPAKIPYKLLSSDTSNISPKRGIREKGIPNSISI